MDLSQRKTLMHLEHFYERLKQTKSLPQLLKMSKSLHSKLVREQNLKRSNPPSKLCGITLGACILHLEKGSEETRVKICLAGYKEYTKTLLDFIMFETDTISENLIIEHSNWWMFEAQCLEKIVQIVLNHRSKIEEAVKIS